MTVTEMSTQEHKIMKLYYKYRNMVDDNEASFEFLLGKYVIQIMPNVCLDTSIKWHIRGKLAGEEKWKLIGCCSILLDALHIITDTYLRDALE